jgi:hypothetical protein
MGTRFVLLALAAVVPGCDWVNSAFLNSIPLDGTRTDDMYVYIAYDGLAPSTVQDALAQGAFAGPQWRSAKFVTDFPGSSDASWTRILRTGQMRGYEYEYYDPRADSLVNAGLGGLAKHILPAFSEALSFEPEYLHAFDFRSHGYSHNFEVYSDTWLSLGESIDELFWQLEGRAQTGNVFIAYLMEGDVLGHTGRREDCTRTLLRLAARMEEFRSAHPERRFHFTLLSDHGMDFSGMPANHYLDYDEELPKVGITPVTSLAGHEGVYAVPILHVRLMYFALHTRMELVPEVGRRVSELESVDFAAGRLGPSHYAIWSAGKLAGTFEHSNGTYLLNGDFSRFGVPAGVTSVSDEALFAMTRDGRYPDLFYRMRTALSEVGAEFPAEVMVSCNTGWQSGGAVPHPGGGDTFLSYGTHGGANADGIGALVSEERDLPGAVRADAFLDLFPHAAEHLRERGIALRDTDPDTLRPHR